MNETRPAFIIQKYRSILRAAIIVEAVNFIVSLTDGIVAGNAIGAEAFAAIGLFAPFLSVSTFLASIVNTGTVLNFSYQVGKFNKRRANEFFSQGVITALAVGAFYALLLLLIGGSVIGRIAPDEEIGQYLSDYFYIILAFLFLQPLSYLLDNLLVADGGEKLSVVANVTLIISNVVCSVLFAEFWDIKGIAIASVLSRVLFILIICIHFLSRKNTLRFVRYWKMEDLFIIFRSGVAKASTYGLEGILTFTINVFALLLFNEDTLVILVVVEKFLGMMTLFIGLSMASQPLIGTLRGENNTKGQYLLMQTVLKDMILVSGILTVLTFFSAPGIAAIFGFTEGELYSQTTAALRIVSSTLILQAVLVLFFIYYVFIDKQLLAFFICLIKNFISPAVTAVILAVVLDSQTGIWIGLAVAPISALVLSALIVFLRYGRKLFPFLITEDPEQEINIYDFTVETGNIVKMAETLQNRMKQLSFPARTEVFAGMMTEEVLMLILDKNRKAKKPVRAECTLIAGQEGLSLIIRDSGEIFDFTDTDRYVDSFRQYIVSTLMISQDVKLYMTTTGYNRNEFFFSRVDDRREGIC